MADERAVAAVCEGIRSVLENAMAVDKQLLNLGNIDITFSIYNATKFASPDVTHGVTIFLYRVLPNLSHRTPPGRLTPEGRQRTQLPLDLHLLLTAWSSSVETQNILAGWMMRTLEDYPTLPASVLNIKHADCFSSNEAVDLVIDEVTLEDLLTLWERLSDGQKAYQISVPYMARAVLVSSRRTQPGLGEAQSRVFDMARMTDGNNGE